MDESLSRHRHLQDVIGSIGEIIGVRAQLEYIPRLGDDSYHPRFDVAWLIEINCKVLYENGLELVCKEYSNDDYLEVPIALFEITGIDSTNKTLVSELASMSLFSAGYSVVVVPDQPFDKKGKKTGMNIKRAKRIVKTMRILFGNNKLYAISHESVMETWRRIKDTRLVSKAGNDYIGCIETIRRSSGKFEEVFTSDAYRLFLAYEYTPSKLNYEPSMGRLVKTDKALIACLSNRVSNVVAELLGEAEPPSLVDIIGVEVERRTTHKHIMGSIVYLSRFYPFGIVEVHENKYKTVKSLVEYINKRRIMVRAV